MATGVFVLRAADLPATTWLSNLAAALVGLALAGATLARRRAADSPPRASIGWVVPVGLALLALTLIAPGAQGVHRWLPLGPVRLHAGAVVLPPLLVALAAGAWGVSLAAALTALLVLLLQPDAAQAVSFCAAWAILAAARRGRWAAVVLAASIALAMASLLRPDPLGPLPHVEGILGMAIGQGPLPAASGLISLAILPLSFLFCLKRPLGPALAAYMGGTLVAAWLGDYPVPVLGSGVSPIFGFYCAVAAALLARPWSEEDPPAPTDVDPGPARSTMK